MKKNTINTSLYNEHIKLGAKLADFAGFNMPINYLDGIKVEYNAVRNDVGVFDVSHMGQIRIIGKDIKPFLDLITTNDIMKLKQGDAQYNLICNKEGGIKDDIIVYMLDDLEFLLVVNASNSEKIYNWILEFKKDDLKIINETSDHSLIAVQGPKSRKILKEVFSENINLHFYKHQNFNFKSDEVLISRTGYTGELGFEILGNHRTIINIWNKLIGNNVQPCGLAVRDILRMEMKYCLYGNDINERTNPYEAGLKWVCNMNKEDFIGKEILSQYSSSKPKNKLICFKMIDRCIPRKDYIIYDSDFNECGKVTSGTFSIGLNYGIGIGYINSSIKGDGMYLELRNKKFKGSIVKPPFIKEYSLHK